MFIILKTKILVGTVSALITLGIFSNVFVTHAIKENEKNQNELTVSTLAKDYKLDNLKNLKIETDRLIITPTVEEDCDTLAEYLLDKEVTQYLDRSPEIRKGFETKEKALEFLKSDSGSSEFLYTFEFTVKLKDNSIPIGKIDLSLFKTASPLYKGVELGYWMGKDYHHKGYLSEAAFELCNMALNASDACLLYVATLNENTNSIGVAKKIFNATKEFNKDIELYLKDYKDDEVTQLFLSKFKI